MLRRNFISYFITIASLKLLTTTATVAADQNEAQKQIDLGNRMLAAGQLVDALTHFHNAIDADANNYMSYFKRGTVFLAMGKFKSALSDLNRVVELKPDFTAARLQRVNILTKQGLFEEAIKDLEFILSVDTQSTEALSRREKLYQLSEDLDRGKRAMEGFDFATAVNIFTQVLESCPWSTDIHQLRSECFLSMGDPSKAIMDLNVLAKLIPDNTEAYFKLSQLQYSLGDADQALNNIRECLRLDSDNKKCSDYYKMLKKLNKLIDNTKKSLDEQRFDQCITFARQLIDLDPRAVNFISKGQSFICTCSTKAKKTELSVESCSKVLEQSPNDADALYNRAQAYISEENLESAQRDCQRAHELENSQRTGECIDRINKLIKQSKKKDYYKILGVKRNADKNTIMKAYRKLAHKWHPDKFPDGPEKEKAQKVFIDIAGAKEVLSDPEKRARFDNGEDPLDPEEQAHGGHGGFHHPFGGHGFNPFGNGNFQFKFKFN